MTRGALTPAEHDLLVGNPALGETQRHYAVLEWIVARFVAAREAGVLRGGVGLETRVLEEACKLRGIGASIVDDAAGRLRRQLGLRRFEAARRVLPRPIGKHVRVLQIIEQHHQSAPRRRRLLRQEHGLSSHRFDGRRLLPDG